MDPNEIREQLLRQGNTMNQIIDHLAGRGPLPAPLPAPGFAAPAPPPNGFGHLNHNLPGAQAPVLAPAAPAVPAPAFVILNGEQIAVRTYVGRFTPEDRDLIIRLRQAGVRVRDIQTAFPSRTRGTIGSLIANNKPNSAYNNKRAARRGGGGGDGGCGGGRGGRGGDGGGPGGAGGDGFGGGVGGGQAVQV